MGKSRIPADHEIRVITTVKNGAVVYERALRPDECVLTLDSFIELARQAGWKISQESEVRHA